LIPCKLFFS